MSQLVTLDNLGAGGLEELFQKAMEKAMWNILDPNTQPDALRTITLTVKIKPTKRRDMAAVTFGVTEKLAPHLAQETTLLVGMEGGSPVAAEVGRDHNQMTIDEGIENAKGADEEPRRPQVVG